jgi:hypothetical protein
VLHPENEREGPVVVGPVAPILVFVVLDPVDAHQFPSSRLAFALIRAAAAGLSLPLFRSAYLCLDTGEYLIDNCASEA